MSATATAKLERHFTPEQAAPLLGTSADEIVKGIKAKKIFAKKRAIRGTGAKGRWIIPESEVRRCQEAGGTNFDEPAVQGHRAAPRPAPRPAPAADPDADEPASAAPRPKRPRRRGKGGWF
jgi:hypothetical protein